MAKIFTSYKFADHSVRSLPGYLMTTVRQYVDELAAHLEEYEHIFKGEEDDEDLSHLSEERIAQLLYDRIFDSSITIVLVSKGMVSNEPEKLQWIPREISYSLSENNRDGRVSQTNAVLAVIIPDEAGSYSYFIQENLCCTRWPMCETFKILRANMFNRKFASTQACSHGQTHYISDPSYIHVVKWDDFLANTRHHLGRAVAIKEDKENYEIAKDIPE